MTETYSGRIPDDDDSQVVQMGFGSSAGNPEPNGKHKHEFHPFDGSAPYFKKHDATVGFLTLFCSCGDTKEIVVEDRR